MEYQICTRCIIDTTVPGVKFDENGECNFCKLHDKLEKQYPLNEKGEKRFKKLVEKIKASGKKNKYDCVVGISGGRDSTYTLYLTKQLGLRPLAVYFNDGGLGNRVAVENMKKAVDRLKVEMRTIIADWKESKDLRLAFLKSSLIDFGSSTDIGLATALYSMATKENIKYVIIGQSFRTEGISPLAWNYLDGRYMKKVHKMFGTIKLRKWKPEDPGFNLNIYHMFYYTVIKRIKTILLPYYINYVRKDAGEIIKNELDWVNTGAHYYDDLYHSLIAYISRVKFNIDRRKPCYSALIRSGQMRREEALDRLKKIYIIENPKVIDMCIKRLGITKEELDKYLTEPPKTFRDFPTNYSYIKMLGLPIKILCKLNLLPAITYDKYFNCG